MFQPRQPYERPALKQDAKTTMSRLSPKIYLVTLLFLVLQYLPTLVQGSAAGNVWALIASGNYDEYLENMLVTAAGRGAALSLVALLLQLFLTILSIGYARYCLKASREEECSTADLFSCFSQFWRFFVLELLMGLFIMLWSCLLVIPGIIATLAYSQAINLMLDDPTLSPMEAIRRSKALMRGHKWEYFVMQLSFFGWSLLSVFAFNLLNIWLQPYMSLTYANYYNSLIGWQPPVTCADDGSGDASGWNNPSQTDPQEWWKE